MWSDRKLSEHFWLSEFLNSETAERAVPRIDNSPGRQELINLERNALMMERVRLALNISRPREVHLTITSGYRCPDLNAAVGSGPTSRHLRGLATDFVAPDFGIPFQICNALITTAIPFRKLIFEHTWVHIDWPDVEEMAGREVYTLMAAGTYAPGIIQRT